MNPEEQLNPAEISDVLIEQAAREQAVSIEEDLLRIRLKTRCFLALTEHAPASICAPIETADPQPPIDFEIPPPSPFNVYPKGRW